MHYPKTLSLRPFAVVGVAIAALIVAVCASVSLATAPPPMPSGGQMGWGYQQSPEPTGCFSTIPCGPWTVTVPFGNGSYTCQPIGGAQAIGSPVTSGGNAAVGEYCGDYTVTVFVNGVADPTLEWCGFDVPGNGCS